MPVAHGRAVYLAYRVGADAARVVPPAVGRAVARGLSRGMTLVWPTRRRQVVRNLERVAGAPLGSMQRWRRAADVFANYGQYWHELFRMPSAGRAWIEAHCRVDGVEHIAASAAAGSGTIIAVPHVGNYDLAAAWLAVRDYRPVIAAERLDPPELFEWFVAARERLGSSVVALGPDALGVLLRALHDNRVVALACDRDLTGVGVPVRFFGEATTLPGGPAMLALRTGARLLPTAVYRETAGTYVARVQEPLRAERRGTIREDVVRVTQDLAAVLERLIGDAPEQWLSMQPGWPSDLVAR